MANVHSMSSIIHTPTPPTTTSTRTQGCAACRDRRLRCQLLDHGGSTAAARQGAKDARRGSDSASEFCGGPFSWPSGSLGRLLGGGEQVAEQQEAGAALASMNSTGGRAVHDWLAANPYCSLLARD